MVPSLVSSLLVVTRPVILQAVATGKSERPSDRNRQLERSLRILRDLDRLGGVDLYELAERYGTSVRTIRRDLAALAGAGLPLVEEAVGQRKRWRVAFRDHLRRLSDLIDAGHYLALRVAMGLGGPVDSSGTLFASLEDLADKLEHVLGPGERQLLATIDGCFHSYEKFGYRSAAPDVFWPLVSAISAQRLCRVTYRAPRPQPEDRTFRVLPLKLFAHDQAMYLHAFVPKHEDVVVLNLQRLRALEVLDARGEPPEDFDPDHWESTTFGIFGGGEPVTYRLQFDERAAPYIRERIWHPSQQLHELPEGGVELELRCNESFEVAAWVASWRTAVRVLEPTKLRAELADYGRWLQASYPALDH